MQTPTTSGASPPFHKKSHKTNPTAQQYAFVAWLLWTLTLVSESSVFSLSRSLTWLQNSCQGKMERQINSEFHDVNFNRVAITINKLFCQAKILGCSYCHLPAKISHIFNDISFYIQWVLMHFGRCQIPLPLTPSLQGRGDNMVDLR